VAANTQIPKYPNTQIPKYPNTQIPKYPNTQRDGLADGQFVSINLVFLPKLCFVIGYFTSAHYYPPVAHDEMTPVKYPYKIATLLYCFNAADEVLMMKRAFEPNQGLWSPPGGKLKIETGESPYACACREAKEETELNLQPADLHLTGIVSEFGYQGQAHWLMFLFEVKSVLAELPPPNREGGFQFFNREQIASLAVPESDRESIWPWFWEHRGGFFAAHCHCHPDRNDWVLEQSSSQKQS
jgi:8-oxo-dGTP diphosphatase